MRKRPLARADAPELSGVLICGLRRALRGQPVTNSAQRRLLQLGYIEKAGWDRFSRLTPAGQSALRAALAASIQHTVPLGGEG